MLCKLYTAKRGFFTRSFLCLLSAGLYDGHCIRNGTIWHVLHRSAHHRTSLFHNTHHVRSLHDHDTCFQSPLLQIGALDISSTPFSITKHTTRSPGTSVIRSPNPARLHVTFDESGARDFTAHKVDLLSLLSAFTSQQYLSHGVHIHCCIVQLGYELDVIVATALINMYSKCGSLEDARGVFDSVSDGDVVLWTAIITAYAKRGLVKDALKLFDSMLQAEVTPDAISFVSMLNACRSCPCFDIEQLCGRITRAGLDRDFGVGMALLNLHVKRGNMTEAREMFSKLPKHNRITWNSMLSLYARLGYVKEALQLFNAMLQEALIPDAITFVAILQAFSSQSALANVRWTHVHVLAAQLASNVILSTSLMNIYGKCGSADDALGMWECIPNKNVVVWSAFIAALTQLKLGQRAVESFYCMQEEGVMPNEMTYASLLEACTLLKTLTRGQQVHACLVGSETLSNVTLITALVNLYSNCGYLDQARQLFEAAERKDVVLWTAFITAHALHNHGSQAAQLFYQMQEEGVAPNLVTFVCVLSACSTLSSLAFGRHVHACIVNKGVATNVDVGTALVNMYGKCGCSAHARGVFDAMTFKDRLSWTAMISAYAHNGEDTEALKVFDLMIHEGVMPDSVTFLSIMSACSHSGLLDLGIRLFFCMMRDFALEPAANHYDCVIDLLGRAGQLNVAEHLVNNMPAKPSGISWTTLLGACRSNTDMHRGEQIARHVCNLESQGAAPYVTLSNLLTAAGGQDCSLSSHSRGEVRM